MGIKTSGTQKHKCKNKSRTISLSEVIKPSPSPTNTSDEPGLFYKDFKIPTVTKVKVLMCHGLKCVLRNDILKS